MSRPAQRRYPWEPLERYLHASGHTTRLARARALGDPNKGHQLARQIIRWERYGVTFRQADALAAAAGAHPWEIWPELRADELARLEAAELAREQERRTYGARWRAANKDRINRYRAEYYRRNRAQALAYQATYKARRRSASSAPALEQRVAS